jgi:signal transduction histidine kinase
LILPNSLKGRLFIVFGSLLIAILSFISLLVFQEIKGLVLDKNMETVQQIAHTGTIPLVDAMLNQSMGKTLPIGYLNRTLKKLRKESDKKIYYAIFVNQAMDLVFADNSDVDWPPIPDLLQFHQALSKQNGNWVAEVIEPVSISTKTWGYLILGFEANSVQAEVKQILFMIYWVVGFIIIVMLFVVNGISEYLTRRLNQLGNAVKQFNLYPSDESLPEGDDEIGQLATNFEHLRRRLIQSGQKIKESERNVFHAEKLASIGRLAAGMAHEINNPLTGIRYSINNILEDELEEKERNDYLRLIDDALKNIESVIAKLLGFSRRKGDYKSKVSFNDALLTVQKLLDYSIKSKEIEIVTNFQPDLPEIHCSAHLLDELSMNLIMNAIDASEIGGKIVCSTSFEKNRIQFSVEDWGHGIRQKDISKVYDPFFTTKEVGKGTGLGLYVVQEIVLGLGGEIKLSTQIDSGAKFTIHLPTGSQ